MAKLPEQRADAAQLQVLVDLRRKQKISQAQMAEWFGLTGSKSRDTVGAWERGTAIPPTHWRGRFLTYLLNDLKLSPYPDEFRRVWDILVEQWDWQNVTSAEWQHYFSIGENPYQGLRPFGEQHTANFFGREEFVQALSVAVQKQPFLVVMGASGSGKSSAIHAGLLPRLSQQHPNWAFITANPGSQPLQALALGACAAAFPHHSANGRQIEADKVVNRWQSGETIPAQTIQSLGCLSAATRILIILDQFEELFNNCPDRDSREQFLVSLLPAIEQPDARCCLLLILRADFMAELLAPPTLAAQVSQPGVFYSLAPLSQAGLNDAITRPAQRHHVIFESGLVARILADVRHDPDKLTLLSFALEQLWDHPHNGNGRLTHQAYDDIGGVPGALHKHAERIFTSLAPAEQREAQSLFVQLTKPNERGKTTRYPTTCTELGITRWQMAQKLAAAPARLLVINDEAAREQALPSSSMPHPAEPVAELIHEALIDEWPRYQQWLEEARSFRLWQLQLRPRLTRWQESQRQDYFLSGKELVDAQEWLRLRPFDISGPEKEFIQSSQRLETRQRRLLIVGLTMILTVVTILALLFWSQRNLAREEAQNTRFQFSNLLATQARSLMATQPRLGLLLAIEAVRLPLEAGDPRPPLAEEQLRQGLAQTSGFGLAGHEAGLTAVAIDPYSRWLATTGWDGQIRLWSLTDPAFESIGLFQYPYPIFDLAFSPDGRWLAGAGSGDMAQLWDLHTPDRKAIPLIGHDDVVGTAAFSPDGRWLATGSNDETARLWDLTAPAPTAVVLGGHNGSVNTVAFSPDNRWLATGSNDSQVRLWSLVAPAASMEAIVLSGHEQSIYEVAFSPDGRWLASASEDGTVRLWEVADGDVATAVNPTSMILDQHTDAIFDIAFSNDNHWLASASADGTIGLWDLFGPEPITSSWQLGGHRAAVQVVTFSPDGRWLASGSEDATVRLWDVSGVKQIQDSLLLQAHEKPVRALAFSSDNQWLASGSGDGVAQLWQLSALQPLSPLLLADQPSGYISTAFVADSDGWQLISGNAAGRVVITPINSSGTLDASLWLPGQQAAINAIVASEADSLDCRWLAAGDVNGRIYLWRCGEEAMGNPLLLAAHTAAISALLITDDGRWLISADVDGVLFLWALSGMPSNTLPAASYHLDGSVHALAVTADSRWLIAAGNEPRLYLWRLTEPALLATPTFLTGHLEGVTQLATSADGRWLLSGSDDRTARLWDLDKQEMALILPGHERHLTAVDISADGRWAATASLDGPIRFWDLAAPGPVNVPQLLKGHTGAVHQVAFSPDGKWLATAGVDHTIRLWDLEGKDVSQAVVTLPAGRGNIYSLAFSQDGHWLAAGGNDGTVRIWTLLLPELIAMACQVSGRNLSLAEWPSYFADRPYHQTCPSYQEVGN